MEDYYKVLNQPQTIRIKGRLARNPEYVKDIKFLNKSQLKKQRAAEASFKAARQSTSYVPALRVQDEQVKRHATGSIDYTYSYKFIDAINRLSDILPRRIGNDLAVSISVSTDTVRKAFSTKFMTNIDDLEREFKDLIGFYRRKYSEEEEPLYLDTISVTYKNTSGVISRGAGGVSYQVACERWEQISLSTYKNCGYAAVVLAKYRIEGKNDFDAITGGKKLKILLKQKGYKIAETVGPYELQLMANHFRMRIVLYNNLYARTKIIEPDISDLKDRQKREVEKRLRDSRKNIEIQLKSGHYITLVRRNKVTTSPIAAIPHETAATPQVSASEMKRISKKRILKEKTTRIFSTWDIETRVDSRGKVRSYAVGFYNGYDKSYNRWFGSDCINQFLRHLWENKNQFIGGHHIYAHNGGKFDDNELLKNLVVADNGHGWVINTASDSRMGGVGIELNGRWLNIPIYDFSEVHQDGKDIKFSYICFRDSIALLPFSLDKICKDYKVQHQKLKELVSHDDIQRDGWEPHVAEIEKYLHNDVVGLHEALDKFNDEIIELSGGLDITKCLTGATLAKKLFRGKYYNVEKTPVYQLPDHIDSFCRNGCYFGGRVEVFTDNLGKVDLPDGKAYYYDFTSLYPDVGRRLLPYGTPEYIKFEPNDELAADFFGFIRVRCRSKNFEKIPLHGHYDTKNGKLLFPHFNDWTVLTMFSVELRNGIESGMYEYELVEGYKFNRGRVMEKFFNELFVKKAEAKAAGKSSLEKTYKIIINSGYGFWGLRTRGRDNVAFYTKDTAPIMMHIERGTLKGEATVGDYTLLRTEKDLEIKDFNVAIAAAITSYARIKLWKLINAIRDVGHKVYYCDTDSVICDCKISDYPEIMRTFCPDGTGNALGSLKNEFGDIDAHADDLWVHGLKYYGIANKEQNIYKYHCKGISGKNWGIKSDMEKYELMGAQCVNEEQLQFRCGRSGFMDEDEPFQMTKINIEKKSMPFYDKAKII